MIAKWLEPYTALGVEKCIHPGCPVGERAEPFYAAYCESCHHAKRMIRFELTDGERAAAAMRGITLGPGDTPDDEPDGSGPFGF